ncbi:MAG: hypothetical protein M2R45_00749 [Verrucomicrobia subdivision 3 bacterium]|nr:hypothetical protein [Limisphaerales bacterium]MCS1413144.1 hypothetical protein [Limisphaerales bacterium]
MKKAFFIFAMISATVLFALAQTNFSLTVKKLMTPEEFKASGLSKLSDEELAKLDAWVQKHSLQVAQIAAQQESVGSRYTRSFNQLEGCYIVADDGKFLGIISSNVIAAKSILNDIGKHGSVISSVSIFNRIGKYGSNISSLSPFNEIASKPPKILNKEGKFVAYLTTNLLKTPRVDLHALIGWLKSK